MTESGKSKALSFKQIYWDLLECFIVVMAPKNKLLQKVKQTWKLFSQVLVYESRKMKLPPGGYCESATRKLVEQDAWNKRGDTKAIQEANFENEVVSGYEWRERWGRRRWDDVLFVWATTSRLKW